MATFQGSKAVLDPIKGTPIFQPKYIQNENITVVSVFTPTAAGLADLWQMLTVPVGATIVDVSLDSTRIDSSTGLTLSVGDVTVPARFILATTIGQTAGGGLARMAVRGGLGFVYAANTLISVTVAAAATTFVAAGTVTLAVTYTMDP